MWVDRDQVCTEVASLARDALLRIVMDHGLDVADVSLLARRRQGVLDDDGAVGSAAAIETRSGARSTTSRRQLAQLWSVLAAVHESLVSGRKVTQRELWYRLKTNGLFSGPPQVNERVMDICAAISKRCCMPVPREALGVVAAPRGSMTGCINLLPADTEAAPQPLASTVFQVPGDTAAIRALRFVADGECPARCVLVVEKDSVFRRLVDDQLTTQLPCVLITACGFPDLATRTLVNSVVSALKVPAFCLTDYNPHGMALMLCYKFGTPNHSLERDASCGALNWIGLRSHHVAPIAPNAAPAVRLPRDSYQPYTTRDRAVLAGLTRRPRVAASAGLLREMQLMHKAGFKVEIEALYCHGFEYLSRFIQQEILAHDDEHRHLVHDEDSNMPQHDTARSQASTSGTTSTIEQEMRGDDDGDASQQLWPWQRDDEGVDGDDMDERHDSDGDAAMDDGDEDGWLFEEAPEW